MKWIDPLQVKRKIVRCKYCDTDVSTPYKGIHDEVEIINGFPSPCRNNGRLNADIAFPSLANIDGIEPKENVKWFIEDVQTRLWWNGFAWTNDPLAAFGCDKKRTAERYALFQKAKNPGMGEYIITEHEFVNEQK